MKLFIYYTILYTYTILYYTILYTCTPIMAELPLSKKIDTGIKNYAKYWRFCGSIL